MTSIKENGIKIIDLTKKFSDLKALDNVSLEFPKDKIHGLLGRNGAGKTTLLNCITGRIFPNKGDIYIDNEVGIENDISLNKIFMMGEVDMYPEGMKVKDAIRWTSEFYKGFDGEYCQFLVDKFELNVNKKIRKLSTGYKSIFKLVVTLASGAEYLVFDEPVLGLDANHRDLFYRLLLEKYSERPFTALISTHMIEEISSLVEEVTIIDKGKILLQESAESLLSKAFSVSGNAVLIDKFSEDKKILGEQSLGGYKTIYLLEDLDAKDLPEGLELGKPDLQKVFIWLTNSKK